MLKEGKCTWCGKTGKVLTFKDSDTTICQHCYEELREKTTSPLGGLRTIDWDLGRMLTQSEEDDTKFKTGELFFEHLQKPICPKCGSTLEHEIVIVTVLASKNRPKLKGSAKGANAWCPLCNVRYYVRDFTGLGFPTSMTKVASCFPTKYEWKW